MCRQTFPLATTNRNILALFLPVFLFYALSTIEIILYVQFYSASFTSYIQHFTVSSRILHKCHIRAYKTYVDLLNQLRIIEPFIMPLMFCYYK